MKLVRGRDNHLQHMFEKGEEVHAIIKTRLSL